MLRCLDIAVRPLICRVPSTVQRPHGLACPQQTSYLTSNRPRAQSPTKIWTTSRRPKAGVAGPRLQARRALVRVARPGAGSRAPEQCLSMSGGQTKPSESGFCS